MPSPVFASYWEETKIKEGDEETDEKTQQQSVIETKHNLNPLQKAYFNGEAADG